MDRNEYEVENGATSEGLPIAPSLAPTLDAASVPVERSLIDARVVLLCTWAVVLDRLHFAGR